MRGLWPHRLLGGDPVPIVQMGLEEHSSHERDRGLAKARGAAQPALIARN